MKAGARLALYGAGLVIAFGGAFVAAGAIVPGSAVAAWTEGTDMNGHGDAHPEDGTGQTARPGAVGVSLDAAGLVLSPVDAPTTVGVAGELSFQIHTLSGDPVTQFTRAHEKDLHLIVVRTDGTGFRHVHPELDAATGTWSAPWTWTQAGSYRVYADFTPATADAEPVTLTRSVEVAGEFTPTTTEVARTDTVDGFTVTLTGDLTAGQMGNLTIAITRDGEPVTRLEPYLGAFGHLVALRQGDLAYLHVHADAADPQAGETGGPEIGFMAEAPTAGRYLLYLDFQVDGQVHTAEFVIDASHGDGSHPDDENTP